MYVFNPNSAGRLVAPTLGWKKKKCAMSRVNVQSVLTQFRALYSPRWAGTHPSPSTSAKKKNRGSGPAYRSSDHEPSPQHWTHRQYGMFTAPNLCQVLSHMTEHDHKLEICYNNEVKTYAHSSGCCAWNHVRVWSKTSELIY